MRSIYTLRPSSPLAPDVSSMIDALDRYQESLYPAESNHLDSRKTLSEPNCKFLGAYLENQLVGIGAAKKFGDYGELKRFYVPEAFRGNGIAELLIAALEYWLAENRVFQSCLETGIHQHAALRFYENLGYQRTGPFGPYRVDPLSVFMVKDLSASERIPRGDSSPFCLVSFSSQLREPSAEYNSVADNMVRLARKQSGYLGMSSVRNDDGRGFTASYWKDRDSISRWRENPHHSRAQKLGREEFYSSFKISIAQVEDLSI